MAEDTITSSLLSEQGVHPMDIKKSSFPVASLILFIGVILIGIGTGYLFSRAMQAQTSRLISGATTTATQGTIAKGAVVGSTDLTTFKDTATGTLQNGGTNGEGQYHLVRPGGDSQNVYLTSSIVDLAQFIGRKITVHGQTQAAKYAGWLMDVGQVEVVE